jgi:Domain of unknown function (DUF222)
VSGASEEFGIGLVGPILEELCLGPAGDPWRPEEDRSRPARLTELFPPEQHSDGWIAGQLEELRRREAADAAYRVALVAELAARRPAALDSPIGRPGAGPEPVLGGGVSEFFADELALILTCSRTAATVLLEQAMTLTVRLPDTWAALADGRLDWPRARALAAELGAPADGSDPEVIAAVEAAVLPQAAGSSIRRLRELTRRELIARDAAAADRRRQQAAKTANVHATATGDGMGELTCRGPLADVAAMRDTVDRYARMLRADGDTRPIGVLRAEVLRALVLRPWDTSRAPVTAQLTIDAPLAALGGTVTRAGEPAPTGSVDGQPVTAAHLKELLRQLDVLGVQPPAGGSLNVAIRNRAGRLLGTATFGELRRLARRGCTEHPHAAQKATEQPADCGCPVLGKPEEVDRYRPNPEQRRFVSTRDRSCRYPVCHSKAGFADQDHVIPYAHGGPTDCDNLCCLCRFHHRLKTHARGWRFHMNPDGTLTVTTPSGVTRGTRPPGLDPPAPQITGSPLPSETDDPPPF